MVVNGSLSKTAVNGGAGANSQLSGLTVAALTIVTLLFLTGLFEDLPEATLAAIVIAAVMELVDIPALVRLYRIYTGRIAKPLGITVRPDFVAAIAAMLGVLVFDTLPGLVIGIAASLLLLLYRASYPHLAELGAVPDTHGQYTDLRRHPDNTRVPGVLIVRPESGLFFANAEHINTEIRRLAAEEKPHAVILDAETVPGIDVTAVTMLEQLAADLTRDGIQFAIARDIGRVGDIITRAETSTASIAVYPTVQGAVDGIGRNG
jgi:MFS superfamily sulfate permease-like transporter